MNPTSERYSEIILSALRAQQLKYEYTKQLKILSDNLTVSELKNRKFDTPATLEALDLIVVKSMVDIIPAN